MKEAGHETKIDARVINQLKDYKGVSHLRKEALSVLVKMLNNKELEHLRKQFAGLDKDQTGMITAQELEEGMRAAGYNITANEMKQMMHDLDYMGNGKINYSEFLAATISIKSVLTQDKMWALFKHFDTDDSGFITPENIKEAFEKTGKHISDKELANILKSHDVMHNGRITFEEFKLMFMDN